MSSFEIELLPSGWRFAAGPDTPILRAAKAAGIRMPSSCRNGTCRACLCSLESGSVEYRIEWPGVTRDEQAEGWMLPCIAHATSDLRIMAPEAEQMGEPAAPPRQSLTGARR